MNWGQVLLFLLDLIVTAVGLFIFGQHVWALRGHFASTSMSGGARVISAGALVTLLIMLVLLWTGEQPWLAQIAGLVLMGASLMLFRAAVSASAAARLRFAFDNALPEQLVTIGPYQKIRHPFYTSYLIYWAGWVLAVWNVWALLPWLVMAALYTIAARHEEQLLTASGMGEAYASYRRRAGLFWPRLTQ